MATTGDFPFASPLVKRSRERAPFITFPPPGIKSGEAEGSPARVGQSAAEGVSSHYVTEAARPKTDEKASKMGTFFHAGTKDDERPEHDHWIAAEREDCGRV
jgi:hypothetical protein